MEVNMDADTFSLVNGLAIRVEEIQHGARHYLADNHRDPRQLSYHIQTLRYLINDLRGQYHARIPNNIFAYHVRNTETLLDHLEKMEGAFSQGFERQEVEDEVIGSSRGRRCYIDDAQLERMVGLKLEDQEMAVYFDCHKKTVYRRRVELGLFKQATKHETPDDVLREYLMHWLEQADSQGTGVIMAWDWLAKNEIPCTREQVRRVHRTLQPEDFAIRPSQTIKRREYHVPFVNSVWHTDGHHKLIRWKFVIHAAVDGKSHLVTFMGVNDNNRAETVKELFLTAVNVWGWPSRVRADHGGENLGIKAEMERKRGIWTAQQNGFHVDLQPWADDQEEQAAWDRCIGPGFIPAEDLHAAGHGPQQSRQSRYEDPMVEVDRFGDRIPSSLYNPEFLQELDVITAGVSQVDTRADGLLQGQRHYLEVLAYVEDFLSRNHSAYAL
ncbi:hypothetical protein QFC20_001380 [Naganishia adeliensis]|uniref:Uncharacterized protein n=1 Tax=Naganishia adeliensis TaxID=92952 RepID=A0ACC2WTY7_9TREE|nr:hypothetical protein QFC20_001380 [Naganishia adeliensis]